MEHIMKLYEENFENLRYNNKTREYRLYDEKRKLIKIGDTIKFVKSPSLDEFIIVDVENIEVFTNWEDAYNKYFDFDFKDNYKNVDEIVTETYKDYYSKEETEKCGCVIFTISRAKTNEYVR